MAAIAYGPGGGAKPLVESFDGTRERIRVRLSGAEAWPIGYVLSEWSGDAGLGSTWPAQVAAKFAAEAAEPQHLGGLRLVKKPKKEKPYTWRDAWERDRQEIYTNASAPTSFHGWEMLALDRWCNDRSKDGNDRRNAIMRAWRTLKALADIHSPALVVLNSLLGDVQPGMPTLPADWEKTPEYLRVVRLCDDCWTGATFDAAVLMKDRKRRANEADEAYKARHAAAVAARSELLRTLGRECEQMISGAVVAYRGAWRSVEP